MTFSRRRVLKMLAMSAAAGVLPRDRAHADPNAQAAGATPGAPPASIPMRPIPPAPVYIAPPAGFGVTEGPFQPTWESLSAGFQIPDWYRDAKFGIWAHWGPQCQPEMGDWYAQRMYQPKNPLFKWHEQHYGPQAEFGFKDVINTWKAEHWDPVYLVNLYKKAGAKFFAAMANHHDNLDMFDSTYQPWNSVRVGPGKDIIGGWMKAARDADLRFAISCHGDRAWSWYQDAQPYDGRMTREDGKGKWWEGLDPQDLYAQYHELGHYDWPQNGEPPIDKKFAEKFFNRVIELIDRYDPDLLYFDDTVLPIYPATDIGLRIAAYYYNMSLKRRGKIETVLTGKKLNDDQRRAVVYDVERGVTQGAETIPWQTDTCIGSWHYERSIYDRNRYKSSKQVVQMLIDIVSKNGCLQLSVPVRGDGTIDEKELAIVEGIGEWMRQNGEAIYGTRPWKIYGEGPAASTTQPTGHFGGARDVRSYTSQDFRFVTRGETLYAFLMAWPRDGKATIKSLAKGSAHYTGDIGRIELVGNEGTPLQFTRDAAGLVVMLPEKQPNAIAWAMKIQGKG